MNKKFGILISISTILLVVLLISVSILRATSKPNPSTTDQLAIPTYTPISRTGDDSGSVSNNPIASLSQEQSEAISKFKNLPPYESDALAISYSALTGNIYIEKKNDKADIELQEFLERNGLTELYTRNPKMFQIVKTNIYEVMSEEEETITEIDLHSTNPEVSPTPSLSYDQQRRQNQTSAFNILVKNLMSLKVPEKSPQDKLVLSLSGTENTNVESGTPTSSTPNGAPSLPSKPVEGAQIGSYKMRVKWDWQNLELVCEPKPGTLAVVSYLKRQFGSSASYGITAACKAYTGKVYAHLAGLGVDYFFLARDPAALKRGNEVFAWLVTNAQNIGIQYIKFWRVHWTPSGGIHCVDNTITPKDQYAHSNHIHFELNLAGANKQTPFFTQGISVPATMKINQEICPLLDPRMK